MKTRNYRVVLRYFISGSGWKNVAVPVEGITYEEAARRASKAAHTLDATYGDSHFWTVDLVNPETEGSYFQLFHGRLS